MNMIKFDREETIRRLKAEIGVADVPDHLLYKHKVIINSPTGKDDSMSLTAAEYVEKGLEELERSIEENNRLMADDSINVEVTPEMHTTLHMIPEPEVPDFSEVRFFDVGEGTDHFLVAINPQQELASNFIAILQADTRTYIKERPASDLTDFDRIISFYQWQGWRDSLDRSRPVSTGVVELDNLFDQIEMKMEFIGDEPDFNNVKGFM